MIGAQLACHAVADVAALYTVCPPVSITQCLMPPMGAWVQRQVRRILATNAFSINRVTTALAHVGDAGVGKDQFRALLPRSMYSSSSSIVEAKTTRLLDVACIHAFFALRR